MKTKTLLNIDKYLIKPVAFILNFFVRLLGKILSIDHNLDKNFKRIVICKFKGMGSIIQSTPMIAAFRKQFPEAEIIFVSTNSNKALLEKVEHIDTVVSINEKNIFTLLFSTVSSLFKLMMKRPDVYIDLEIYSSFSTLFTLFTFSKNRIGYYLRSSSFNMGIYTHMMYFNSHSPIAEVYLQIARLFDPTNQSTKEHELKLYPLYKNLLKFEGIPIERYVVINPNASDLRLERRWGARNYRELILSIIKAYPKIQIFVIGSKDECSYSEKTIENTNSSNVSNLAGQTSIDELISLIHNATLMITNDTGPMHIAFACGTPTVALFGPASPEQYPGIENTTVIYKKVFCSPCVHDFAIPPCKGDNICMKLISQNEVLSKVKQHLDKKNPSNSPKDDTIYYSNKQSKTIGLVRRGRE